MQTDNLEATLNYAEVYEVVKTEMGVPSRLLEHVAGRIRSGLLENFLKSQADISALRKRGRLLPASRARRLSRWSGDGLVADFFKLHVGYLRFLAVLHFLHGGVV